MLSVVKLFVLLGVCGIGGATTQGDGPAPRIGRLPTNAPVYAPTTGWIFLTSYSNDGTSDDDILSVGGIATGLCYGFGGGSQKLGCSAELGMFAYFIVIVTNCV